MARAWWRRGLLGLALTAATVVLALGLLGCLFSGPRYKGPVSDHFDGERFVNQDSQEHGGLGAFLRWRWSREPGPWQPVADAVPGPPPPPRVSGAHMRVTFVNHATVLVQVAGLNILTDPIWSERCSPVSWAGPRRVRPPGILFADLPPIDVVVVSHNHYDHMDLPTLERLFVAHRPRFFVGLGNGPLLAAAGIDQVQELDWWQSVPLADGVQLTAVPAQHFSSRGLCDRDATLWAGYVVQTPAGAAYFAGDTGFGPHFQQIRTRFGPLRLAVLPIGAFRPEWFMAHVHVSPAEAVQAHRVLEASTSVGMHFGTFPLADDGQEEAVVRLRAALAQEATPPRFWVLDFGEGRDVPAVDAP